MKTEPIIQKELSELIHAAHSPFHCCSYIMEQLTQNGFSPLALKEPFFLEKGGKYVIRVFDTTILAVTIGRNVSNQNLPKLRMITAHTDWPGFVIKPNPVITNEKYVRLNTEPYGGAVYHTWIDRPLGIAGKVCMKSADPFSPHIRLFDSQKPVAIIPGLAIHMDKDINSELKLNPQTHLLPLWMLEEKKECTDFAAYLANELDCEKEDILDYELFLYNFDSCESVGMNDEFFSAPRIDNSSGILSALDAVGSADTDNDLICISAFYNNEEIGNMSKQGADSRITEQILERIFSCLSLGKEELYCSLNNGLCLSLDVAHALHPAHSDKNDPTNRFCLGDGVCIKLSARQSYATDSSFTSIIQAICEKHGIPYAKFVNRSDQRGGSTLGTVISSSLCMPCVDAGVFLLSMHSARELIAIRDQVALCELSEKFFAK